MLILKLLVFGVLCIAIDAIKIQCKTISSNSTCDVENSEDFKIGDKLFVSSDTFSKSTILIFKDKSVENVPENLGKIFPSLNILKIDRSKLKTINRADFNGMTKLKELKLPNNELKKLESDVFYDLYSLTDLDLSENSLSEIDSKQFAKLLILKNLNLDFNDLREIDVNLFKNNKMLEKIYLKNNVIEKLSTLLFRNLPHLTSLELDSNRINALPDNIFESNKVMQKLTISNNFLRFVGKSNIEKVKDLTVFDFRDNDCTDSLTYDYDASNLEKVLEAQCKPSEQIIIQWLQEEVSDIKRLKRESDQAFKCADLEIQKTMENINSTRDFLSGLISTSKKSDESKKINVDSRESHLTKTEFSFDLSKAETNLTNEIQHVADKVKGVLLPNFEKIPKDTEKIIKIELQNFSDQIKNTITKHIDSKSNETEKKSNEAILTAIQTSASMNGKFMNLPKQVAEQFKTKFEDVEKKLNLILAGVQASQSSTNISDIKTQMENINSTRDFLSGLISSTLNKFDESQKNITESHLTKKEFSFDLSKAEKNFANEIHKVKEALLPNFDKISNVTEKKIKTELQNFSDQITKHIDSKSNETEKKSRDAILTLINEKFKDLSNQVAEQIKNKFENVEKKLDLIQAKVPTTQTSTNTSDIITQISEPKMCDSMKFCFDFMEKVIDLIKDTEHTNFFSELKKVNNDLISKKYLIEISFKNNLFKDDKKAQEEVTAFKEILKSQYKDLKFSSIPV